MDLKVSANSINREEHKKQLLLIKHICFLMYGDEQGQYLRIDACFKWNLQ